MLLKYTLVLLFTLFATNTKAQTADTLVIYEYLYQTDTVWVEDEVKHPIPEPISQLNTIYNQVSTPILDNLSDNTLTKNSQARNKTNMTNKILLSFQNLNFSHPQLNLRAGITYFGLKPNPHVYSALMLGDHYGIELKIPVKDSDLSFSLGFEQRGYNIELIHYVHFLSHGKDAWYVSRSLDTYRSLPFLIYYEYLGLDLFAGYELKMFSELKKDDPESFSYHYRNEHALVTGFDKQLGRRFAFSTKLYLGDLFYKPNPDPFHIISRTSLCVSFKYNLFRKQGNY